MRSGRKVWSKTAQRYAVEVIGTVYKERVELLGAVAPGLEEYRDLVLKALPGIVEQIRDDTTTRQALMFPRYAVQDPPCCFALQFMLRDDALNGTLEVVAYMRSSSTEKWQADVQFYRWAARQVELGLVRAGFDISVKHLTVFKGSDHEYVD